MSDIRTRLIEILDEYDPEGGTFPGQDEDLETFWGAQADAIMSEFVLTPWAFLGVVKTWPIEGDA